MFYGPESGSIQVESGCLFKVTGKAVVIYTGDGTEEQSTSGWTTLGYNVADEPGCIEVETGDGTDVWEQWIDLADKSFDEIGVGTLGNWYKYDISTGIVSFGDGGKPNALTSGASSGQDKVNLVAGADFTAGDYVHIIEGSTRETIVVASVSSNELTMTTNLVNSYTTSAIVRIVKGGNVVPNGARVRVYNIGLGTKNSGGTRIYSTTVEKNFNTDLGPGGKLSIDKCMLFGFYIYLASHSDVTISYCGGVVKPRLDASPTGSADHWIIGVDRYLTASVIQISGSANWIFNNCKFAAYSYSVFSYNLVNCVWNDCDFIVIARTSSTNRTMPYGTGGVIEFNRCRFIGGSAESTGSNITLTNCQWSDATHGAPFGSFNTSALSLDPGTDTVVNNFTIVPDGNVDLTTAVPIYGCTIVKNSTLCFKGSGVWRPAVGVPSKLINCYIESTFEICPATAGMYDVKLQGVKTNFIPQAVSIVASKMIFKQVDTKDTSVRIDVGSAVDTHFYELRLPTITSGIMGIIFCPRSATGTGYTESSIDDIKWNQNGSMYIVNAGGWLLYEWPHKIIGVTAFPSGGAITIAGSGTANFTIEYQIDVGSGWTSLAALNHTNLSAHTINPLEGFRFRVKISHPTGSMSNYLYRLNWSTTVDYDTYLYPVDTVNITLQNVQDGSRYRIYNETTSQEIAEGVQSGTADIVIPDVPYNGSDETLSIYVRRATSAPLYKPLKLTATLNENGATVYVSQVLDI